MSKTMSTSGKLVSLAKVPAFFVGAFVLAFLAMTAADAVAQGTAEVPEPTTVDNGSAGSAMPDHGFAPPSDEQPPAPDPNTAGVDGNTGANPPAGAHDPHAKKPHHDASLHFNFFDFGWRKKDLYGGVMGDGQMIDSHTGQVVLDDHTGAPAKEEGMSAPFIFMVLNFALLFALLAWKGGPIARKAAEERHDQIKNALEEAAKLREQAQGKLTELESKLKSADAEIKAMVDGIRKDAETDKARILDNAEKLAAQMKRDAESRIAAEIEAARAALTREVTDAATTATEKILRDKLMPGDQSKLVTTFIADLGTAKGGSDARR
jgi:F0F1-type ATP synthase membrane subunit b/b'